MSLGTAVVTFALLAGALTVTPGLDTALVLRSALPRPRREAVATGAGIIAGPFVWGAAAAAGISALLAASEVAYTVLRFAGAAYLLFLGIRMLVQAARGADVVEAGEQPPASAWRAARTGLGTNLLNPKVVGFGIRLAAAVR